MKRRGALFFAVILMAGLLALWGCPKKTEVSSVPEQDMKTEQPAPEQKKEEPRETAAAAEEGLKSIYFDFDQSFVRDDARRVMKANADWLKANPKVKVRVEGNCDERGTIEYNQALGQRRAAAAKKYLTDLGIAASRISLISYGKEKPTCTAHTESCWQENRRGDLVAQ